MDCFLEKYPRKLTLEELNYINKQINIEETENIKSYHTHREAPGPEDFTNEFHYPFKEPDSI